MRRCGCRRSGAGADGGAVGERTSVRGGDGGAGARDREGDTRGECPHLVRRRLTSSAPRHNVDGAALGQFRAVQYDRILREALKAVPLLSIVNQRTSAHRATNLGTKRPKVRRRWSQTRPSLSHSPRYAGLSTCRFWRRGGKGGGCRRQANPYAPSTDLRRPLPPTSSTPPQPSHAKHRPQSPNCAPARLTSTRRFKAGFDVACREAGFFGSLDLAPILSHPRCSNHWRSLSEERGVLKND